MFSLFCGLWNYATEKPERNILLLGLDRAGKTAILEKIKDKFCGSRPASLERIFPTIGLNIAKFVQTDQRLVIWDLGGAEGLRKIWKKYYEEASALIFVIDASDPSRLAEAASAFQTSKEGIANGPILIFLNRYALGSGGLSVDSIKEELCSLSSPSSAETDNTAKRPLRIQPVCPNSGEGIKEGVEWIATTLRRDCKD